MSSPFATLTRAAYHMQTPPPSNPLKRRRSDPHSLELESKKRKTVDIANPSPATQQGTLSTTPLTRSILRAFRVSKQREAQVASVSRTKQRIHRPNTRLTVAEQKRHHPPLKTARIYLQHCGHKDYKALQSFSKHGGPDLRDLRGYQRAADRTSSPMESSQNSSISRRSRSRRSSRTKLSTDAGTNKSLSPYNRSFQQILVDARVFPPHYQHPDGTAAPEPKNLYDIKQRLVRRRPSLSLSTFTEEKHKAFILRDANAKKEEHVRRNVIPIIQGEIQDLATASGEILFTNLTPLITNENENIASGKPDFYHGARPEQLDRAIRYKLKHLIIPSTQLELPILPNHFTAVKGPDGSAAVAKRQATYDGFLGARGVHALRTFGQTEPSFDNKAYTFAFIYHSGTLTLYTCHPVQPDTPGQQPAYYMNQVRSISMLDDAETWIKGATVYRNAMDMAKEIRDDSIREANTINRASASSLTRNVSASNASASFTSTGSQIGLASLTMDSQVETAPSSSSEDFQTAESSHDEDEEGHSKDEAEEEDEDEDEDEEEDSPPPPPKRASAPRRQASSGKKRRTRDDSADEGGSRVSSQGDTSQTSSAAKKAKARGRSKPRR